MNSTDQLNTHALTLSANAIRALAMDAVQTANSGHPGMPMGSADFATVLWAHFLRHDPQTPNWFDRDRFILSAGHGSMLLYALLHLSGYDLPMEQIEQFRQWGSHTPGHPEYGHTVGVETTTGPLGQGIANGVGMALAEAHLAQRYNREGFEIINHYTYVLASDGDLMEGISHEACSVAGHLALGKLIVLWDDNHITIDGPTELSIREDVLARFAAYGWQTLACDGHNHAEIYTALSAARANTHQPTLISCRTIIGYGSPNKANSSKSHGSPLGTSEIALTREKLRWPYLPFVVPDEAYQVLRQSAEMGTQNQIAWQTLWRAYSEAHPELAEALEQSVARQLPSQWTTALPTFPAGQKIETRKASGKVLSALVPLIPSLIGGSADLTGSNNTLVANMGFVDRGAWHNRYINYGVREHAMAGMMNGMALHGGLRPYAGTFLVFSDYMRGSMRLSALSKLPVIYVLTHDSIGLGEDGPTHQPIEHLTTLRAMPNMWVFRPADANETACAWQTILTRQDGPSSLVLTRQPVLTLEADTRGALQGGYVLRDSSNPQAVILATGSEVEIALEAFEQLRQQGVAVRLVSLPCWELFEAQSAAYRASVLPPHLTARVAIEAGATLGWYKYVGSFGKVIGLDHFGASAPAETLYRQFGLTSQAVVEAVQTLLG